MRMNVLIIETDEPPMRLLAWGLREEGLEVATVSGPDAVKEAPRPDAVIMNTGMKAEEKRLWISSLRYLLPGIVVIDIANRSDRALTDSGADAYVEPPIHIERILQNLRKLVVAETEEDPS